MKLDYAGVKKRILGREAFYEASKGVFGVIATSDPTFYYNVIITKGVVGRHPTTSKEASQPKGAVKAAKKA